MREEYNIFWVEDETEDSLADLRGSLESSLHFNLEIASNYFDAVEMLRTKTGFHLIIVDIRIPKGNISLDELTAENAHFNQFGFDLIDFILKNGILDKKKIYVYTNESWSNVSEKIEKYGIAKEAYLQKDKHISNKQLEKLFLERLRNG
jgi:CheY-like chemotaxis protein